ncbi:hypothetical protein AGABI2DRAFT_192144 [Agaricus bisporus var. bisporus H97]|uniref:hypothetical protein n=1 Tax=Agaricus bisporus var. bisporus (strain H97 / ATCC MYA-4626 / FGSC 10389) TaxID=936046 RepID=UPI00029F661D|nr:hypothetical protein AGABI2DRAFT_192144 [Agaricus bisporus var. bisporus H97]EKV48572.1 hypothetical protein AGABI2DRAFT_192144 [Agaricus bisporus var. bisporus H97]
MSTEERSLLPRPPQTPSPQQYGSNSLPRLTVSKNREKLEKRLLRKLDVRMSMLLLMYIVNYIDRISAAAARLRGFEDDLKLKGAKFASILSIFYVGYITLQVPSNMILSQVKKPSLYIPCCMMVWGVISFMTGFVTNYCSALAARFLLGFSVAAFFPGALYLIARWYKRDELSLRIAFFACGSNLSNAFGSLIASAVLDLLDGALGYSAWRWLFFVEGAFTILVAIIATFILPDFPESENISWLTSSEHALAKARMREDTATEITRPESLNQYNVKSMKRFYNVSAGNLVLAISDWKVWYMALAELVSIISSSHYLYFPTLTKTMGYNTTISLLLCAPPWLLTAVWCLWLSWHSDKTGERCMHVIVPHFIAIVGAILAMSMMNTAARYVSLFLVAQTNAGFRMSHRLVFIYGFQSSRKTRSRTCAYQCRITVRKYSWILYMGEGLGTHL